jgi:hypothetical protein
MRATLSRSGQLWRLSFLWADMDKSLLFESAKDARNWAKTWSFKVLRVSKDDRT